MDIREHAHYLIDTLPEPMVVEMVGFGELLEKKCRIEKKPKKKALTFEDFFGCLADSPNFKGDPVKIQRKLRSEWR